MDIQAEHLVYIIVVTVFLFLVCAWMLIKELRTSKSLQQQLSEFRSKFSEYFDAEKESQSLLNKSRAEADEIIESAVRKLAGITEEIELKNRKIDELKNSYSEKKMIYDSLNSEIDKLKEDKEFIDIGFYSAHFDDETSEKQKNKVKAIRDKQKIMLRDKTRTGAIYCTTDWQVHGSRAEGKKMVNQGIRLSARAFNSECDVAISNVTYKNYITMQNRIVDAFDKINDLNKVNTIFINKSYLQLKLDELECVYFYKQLKQREKEEQREIKAQMAEERRAELEIQKAIKEAAEEERRAQLALEKAKKELQDKHAKLSEQQSKLYHEKIAKLEQALVEAESKGERALSMAQQTKSGYVYIISNVGSFGDDVFKIGMTRRINPQDRVDELGSASVPFTFDVHAMIKSDDAPQLESALHKYFDSKRTNAINRRKEFFNVSVDDIKSAVFKFAGDDVDFIETAAAEHFRETLAIRKKSNNSDLEKIKDNSLIFADAL